MQRLLVDTCALIWLATGDTRLSDAARNAMSRAELLCYSSVSIWEIARKVKKGELEMPVSPGAFAELLTSKYEMKEMPLNNDVMLRASALPEIHRDPADRFIIATAFLNNCTVVTSDRRFAEYGLDTIR